QLSLPFGAVPDLLDEGPGVWQQDLGAIAGGPDVSERCRKIRLYLDASSNSRRRGHLGQPLDRRMDPDRDSKYSALELFATSRFDAADPAVGGSQDFNDLLIVQDMYATPADMIRNHLPSAGRHRHGPVPALEDQESHIHA